MNRVPPPRRAQFDLQQIGLIMLVCAVMAALGGYAVRQQIGRLWVIAAAAVPVLITAVVSVLWGIFRGRK